MILTENQTFSKSATARRLEDNDVLRTNRRAFFTINDAVGHILDIAHEHGISKKDRDVALAILRTMPANMTAYQSVKRSNESIGRKIAGLRSNEPKRLQKSAGQRLWKLFNQGQPTCGKQLFSRLAITTDGEELDLSQEPESRFDYYYTDHLTPAAQAAIERARNHPDWKTVKGQEKQQILRTACEWAFFKMLPNCENNPTNDYGSNKLGCEDYAQMAEARLLREADAYAAKIANEYDDIDRAQSFARYLSRKFSEMASSLHRISYKRKNPLASLLNTSSLSLSESVEVKESVVSPSLFNLLDLLDQPAEIGAVANSLPEEEGDVIHTQGAKPESEPTSENAYSQEQEGAKSDPSAPKNSNSDSSLAFTIPQSLWKNERFGWVCEYAARGWAILPNQHVVNGTCSCTKGAECKSTAKHPAAEHGVDDATSDLAKLSKFWLKHPGRNVGIATGAPSGIDALDFDGEDGLKLFEQWKEKGWITDDCLTAITPSGGRHVIIKHLPGLKNGVKPVPGLDIRTTGGQIIVQGSETLKGKYEWVSFTAEPLNPSADFTAYLLSIAAKDQETETVNPKSKPKPFLLSGEKVSLRGRKAPDYARCLATAPRKADGQTPDWSVADAKFVTFALSQNFSEDEASRMLADVSDLSRKSNPADYIARTIRNAASRVAHQIRT